MRLRNVESWVFWRLRIPCSQSLGLQIKTLPRCPFALTSVRSPLALTTYPGFAQFDQTGLDEGDVAAGATSGWLIAVGAKECES